MVRFKNRYILAELEFASEEGISDQVTESSLVNVLQELIFP